MKKFLLIILIIYLALEEILSKCTMQQTCDVTDPKCLPDRANNTDPTTLQGNNVVCSEFLGKDACCNDGQNILLTHNFETLGYIFGNEYGGCDICAINLKRFWCEFTCSPNQSDFLSVQGYQNFTIDNDVKILLVVNLTLNRDMNCDIFKSCKKTRYASELPLLSNAIGFTSFQGAEANRVLPVFISMDYSTDKGMNLIMDKCDLDVTNMTTLHGFPVKEACRCNSCESACKFDNKFTMSAMEGFNLWVVVSFYLFVIFATLMITYCKKYHRKGKHSDDFSRYSSQDYTIKKVAPINEKSNSSQNINISNNN